MSDWQKKIRSELESAEAARKRGNEGMARVSARRAAGWAAKAFLEEQGIQVNAKSGFQLLLYLKESDLLSAASKASLEKLTSSLKKENPQDESIWPHEGDLIVEARNLAQALVPNNVI